MPAKIEVQKVTNHLEKKDDLSRIDTDENVSEFSRSNPSLDGINPTWDSRSVGGECEAERTVVSRELATWHCSDLAATLWRTYSG
jgi:hypothetical protein